METERRYFIEGLFVIGFAIAVAFFAVWLASTQRNDDVLYRIHFSESVSGLAVGDAVKYQGVDVGTVKSIRIDPDDSRWVLVEVGLRKETPVNLDTRASLALKGLTGTVFIELRSSDPTTPSLLATTPPDKVPEILSEKTGLKAMLDDLPKVVEKFGTVVTKFAAIEDQAKKVVANANALTEKIKANPSLLLKSPPNNKE